MIIKLLPGNLCNSALVSLSKDEVSSFGVGWSDLSLENRNMRKLITEMLVMLETICGLRRDGNIVGVACRPMKTGGCRFYIQFTDRPGRILFSFAQSDDLLDALSQLQRSEGNVIFSKLKIVDSGGKYKIYIPAEMKMSENALAILSEYAE